MRISPQLIEVIKRLTAATFGTGARVGPYCARVDDTVSGGGFDLLVESDLAVEQPALQAAAEAMPGRVERSGWN
jgi:hypothetical protein